MKWVLHHKPEHILGTWGRGQTAAQVVVAPLNGKETV